MTEPAICVEGVSKRYHLGTRFQGALSQRLESAVRAPFRSLGRAAPPPSHDDEEFWALRDVSLDVEEGEAFGLIGANGAGKSTLLKLLSHITLPTEGRITLRGRVGTLLEVGTGFHPELTGRENVFLNGAILGMRRQEIAARFDDIVLFSGIEQFLDTPVKRYSSGMHVRLAFAVAAYLQPKIMLVDEVLAVGDTEFQRKCLGKMDDVAQAGRTVVFVSHNLNAVQRLCTRTAWIDHGRIAGIGPSAEVIASYLGETGAKRSGGEATVATARHRVGTGKARLLRAAMQSATGEPIDHVKLGEPWSLRMSFELNESIDDVNVEVAICDPEGARVVTALSSDDGEGIGRLEAGEQEVALSLDVTLLPADYWIEVGIHEGDRDCLDFVQRLINFSVIGTPYGETVAYPWNVNRGGVRPGSNWTVASLARRDADPAQVQTER